MKVHNVLEYGDKPLLSVIIWWNQGFIYRLEKKFPLEINEKINNNKDVNSNIFLEQSIPEEEFNSLVVIMFKSRKMLPPR